MGTSILAVCWLAYIRRRRGNLNSDYANPMAGHFGSTTMSKDHDSRREGKKEPLKTQKEKKKEKQDRKQKANPVQPFIKE